MADQQVMEKPDVALRDALDDLRRSTQELHRAIVQALTKRAEATRPEIEALATQARDTAQLARSTIRRQSEAAEGEIKERLAQAADKLDSAERYAVESLKRSGSALLETLSKALAEAAASAQQVSEAVAAKRADLNRQTS